MELFSKLMHGGDYNPEQWLDRPDIGCTEPGMVDGLLESPLYGPETNPQSLAAGRTFPAWTQTGLETFCQ